MINRLKIFSPRNDNTGSRKFLIVGCSHGHLYSEEASSAALRFKKKWKPDITIHLGDFIDASAFMARGNGTNTSSDDIRNDMREGIEFLNRLDPQVIFCGNHEARLWDLSHDNNELKRECALSSIDSIRNMCNKLGAELVEYGAMRDPGSFRRLGPLALCHGWSFGMNAEREHAQMTGMPTVMAHVHRMQRQPAYAFGGPEGISIGCLAEIDALRYASRRKATSGWANGLAWGEVTETDFHIHLERLLPWSSQVMMPAI